MARLIVLITYLFGLASTISFRKDYSPPFSLPSRLFKGVRLALALLRVVSRLS